MAYEDEVLADSPVAYYRFQEASGNPQDSSGNGNHVTSITGTPGYQAASPIDSDPSDYAMGYDLSLYLEADDDPTLDYGNTVTYECWAARAETSPGNFRTMLARLDGLAIFFYDDYFYVSRSGVAFLCHATVKTTDTNPHHYAVTKTGDTVLVYVDGQAIATSFDGNATMVNSANTLDIGHENGGAPFHGVLDEVAVYNTVLSATRIRAHYEAALSDMFPDRFGGPQQLTASAATIYTAAVPVIVDLISVSNPSGSAVDLTLSIGTDAAGTRMFDDFEIPADTQRDFRTNIVLDAAEIIQAFASSAGVLDITLNGRIV